VHDAHRQRRQLACGHPHTQGQLQDFTVGSDCRAQLLVLQAAGGGNQLGAEFTLRSVDVAPR
jgi:hypothetical protein